MKNFQTVFYMMYQFIVPPTAHSFPFSPHPQLHLLCTFFWMLAILTSMRRHVIVVFICISLITCDIVCPFMSVYHVYIFFWGKNVVFPVVCPLLIRLFFLLSCMSSIYSLDIALIRYDLLKFFPFCKSSFYIVDFSYAVKKLLILCLHVFIFYFVASALAVISKKILLRPTSRSFSFMFLSKSFMASGVSFMSLIHINFWEPCKTEIWFYCFTCGYAIFPDHLLKRMLFLLWGFFIPSSNIVDQIFLGYFWALDLFHCFMCLILCHCHTVLITI